MKKLLFITAFLLSVLIVPARVLAIDLETNRQIHLDTIKENKAEIEKLRLEMREKIKNQIETRKATVTQKLTEVKKEKVRNYFNQMMERFDATVARLEKLIGRIETRLTKIDELKKYDTTSIRNELSLAKTLLGETKSEIEATKANLETVLASNQPKEAFSVIKTSISKIRQNLIEVHKRLVHLVGDIHGLGVSKNEKLTPTPV